MIISHIYSTSHHKTDAMNGLHKTACLISSGVHLASVSYGYTNKYALYGLKPAQKNRAIDN